MPNLCVQALVLADMIYQDRDSGKYVLAGTFHQLNVPSLPCTFSRTIGLFISLLSVQGHTKIDVEFVDEHSDDVLMRTQSLEVVGHDQEAVVDFALEVPYLPLPHEGRYLFRLATDGVVLGTAPLTVQVVRPPGG